MLYRSLRKNVSPLSSSSRTCNYTHIFQERWFSVRLLQCCPCAVRFSSVIQNQLSDYVRFTLQFHNRLLNNSIHVENNYFPVKFAIKFSRFMSPYTLQVIFKEEVITARVRKFGCCPHKAVLMNPIVYIFFRIPSSTKVCIEL